MAQEQPVHQAHFRATRPRWCSGRLLLLGDTHTGGWAFGRDCGGGEFSPVLHSLPGPQVPPRLTPSPGSLEGREAGRALLCHCT